MFEHRVVAAIVSILQTTVHAAFAQCHPVEIPTPYRPFCAYKHGRVV